MNDERIRDLLREAVPPPRTPELRRDLWPSMRERLDQRAVRFSWVDAALAAALTLALILVPQLIPTLLYQL